MNRWQPAFPPLCVVPGCSSSTRGGTLTRCALHAPRTTNPDLIIIRHCRPQAAYPVMIEAPSQAGRDFLKDEGLPHRGVACGFGIALEVEELALAAGLAVTRLSPEGEDDLTDPFVEPSLSAWERNR